MRLLNKYQSRAMQFTLELLARLEYEGELDGAALAALAEGSGLDYAGQVLEPLRAAELIEYDGKRCRLAPGAPRPRLPMGRLEKDFLGRCLQLPEAALFLTPELREKLEAVCGAGDFFAPVEVMAPAGAPLPEQPGPEGFRTLLEAIHRRYLIEYTYRTRDDREPRQAAALPWKLEYSAYDRRWWAILYDPEQRRTIKARLDNLEQPRLLRPAGVPEADINAAMDALLEPEPLVLEVHDVNGALERCFLVFENQLFEETHCTAPGRYRLSFRYYRFDRSEILRRLLYLGPPVRLVGPASMREALGAMLDAALAE